MGAIFVCLRPRRRRCRAPPAHVLMGSSAFARRAGTTPGWYPGGDRQVKVVLVGDHCGKTAFVQRVEHLRARNFGEGEEVAQWKRLWDSETWMVGFDPIGQYSRVLLAEHEQVNVQLNVWDTSSSEDYDRLRPLAYPQTDVFALCFSLAHLEEAQQQPSLTDALRERWLPEIARWEPDAPFVLLGMKADQRAQGAQGTGDGTTASVCVVQREEGQALARMLGAAGYLESSAKEMGTEAIQEVLDVMAALGLQWSVADELLDRNAAAVHPAAAMAVPVAEEALAGDLSTATQLALPPAAPPQVVAVVRCVAGGPEDGVRGNRSSSSSSSSDEDTTL